MNFLKRSFHSLVYHKKNTISIFFVFLILSTLILSGLSLNSACEQSLTEIRKNIGARIILTNSYKVNLETDGRNATTLNRVEEMANFAEIKEISYNLVLNGYAIDFEPLLTEEQEGLQGFGNIYLSGETDSAKSEDFYFGEAQLLSGKHIEKTDKKSALIHISLAEKNQLTVGDTITVKSRVNDKEETLEIVGLFTTKNSGEFSQELALDEPENKIYLDAETAFELTGNTMISQAIFELDDPAAADTVVKQARELPTNTVSENSIVYTIDDEEYRSVSGSLASMLNTSTIMVAASIIMGTIILTLLVILAMKSRDFEIGILLSIGEIKWRIILQMILEILVPVMLSITTALIISDFISQQLAGLMGLEIGRVYVEGIHIMLTYLFGLVLTLFASVFSIYKVIFYQPKKILMAME